MPSRSLLFFRARREIAPVRPATIAAGYVTVARCFYACRWKQPIKSARERGYFSKVPRVIVRRSLLTISTFNGDFYQEALYG
jgi:hypothetical protein